mmetsp:Transcript_49951/g.95419  ORF Transcript_49951/g.95419 Transcript_49951/m.95419 type:complete len:315 (-) Transcript_49951:213-1157(-)
MAAPSSVCASGSGFGGVAGSLSASRGSLESWSTGSPSNVVCISAGAGSASTCAAWETSDLLDSSGASWSEASAGAGSSALVSSSTIGCCVSSTCTDSVGVSSIFTSPDSSFVTSLFGRGGGGGRGNDSCKVSPEALVDLSGDCCLDLLRTGERDRDRTLERDRGFAGEGDLERDRRRLIGDRDLDRRRLIGDRDLDRRRLIGDRDLVRRRVTGDRDLVRRRLIGERDLVRIRLTGERDLERARPTGERDLDRGRKTGDRDLFLLGGVGERRRRAGDGERRPRLRAFPHSTRIVCPASRTPCMRCSASSASRTSS